MSESKMNVQTVEDDVTYNYEPDPKIIHDDDATHTEIGTKLDDGLENPPNEESFSTKDFRTVDTIMDIIDAKKAESPDKGKDDANQNKKEQSKESSTRKNSDIEQSLSSEDGKEKDEPAESDDDTQESKSDSDKEDVEFTDRDDDNNLIVDVDGDNYKVADIVSEWQNNRDWQKSNTEKAQELAEERKVLDAFNNEEVMSLLKDKDFLDAVDDWSDGKENPLRSVVENLERKGTIVEKSTENAELSAEEVKLSQQRTELEVDREILDLQSVDESLRDEKEIEQLLQFAVDNQMTLEQAHKFKLSEDLGTELEKVQSELKERNKELSDLKKTSGKSITPSAPIRGSGSKGESLPPNTDGWRGAEDRVLAKLGL